MRSPSHAQARRRLPAGTRMALRPARSRRASVGFRTRIADHQYIPSDSLPVSRAGLWRPEFTRDGQEARSSRHSATANSVSLCSRSMTSSAPRLSNRRDPSRGIAGAPVVRIGGRVRMLIHDRETDADRDVRHIPSRCTIGRSRPPGMGIVRRAIAVSLFETLEGLD